MSDIIKKLPAVFQTTTEKKFFDATFDQVFSKKDSDYIAGYLGRRIPGQYNPITDFYMPEPTKNRTWWQLEPTAYSQTVNTERSNVFFYEDLLEYIESYGGNTQNQDRLTESGYYSYAPPIDYDMFANYQNYYWVDQRLATVEIKGVLAADIIGQKSYTTPPTATPPNIALTTGMSILLTDDPVFTKPLTVEFIAGCEGIRLVKQDSDLTYGVKYEYLPWDGSYVPSKGKEIFNKNWDVTTWEVRAQQMTGDYITIQRGSVDGNAWSRTNKWYHIDAINQTIKATGFEFPSNAVRALRPIIQFVADLKLHGYGARLREQVNFGFAEDQFGLVMRFNDIQGKDQNTINQKYGISINNEDLVVFFRDDSEFNIWDLEPWEIPPTWDAGVGFINRYIFKTEIQGNGTIIFRPYTSWDTPILDEDMVLILEDGPGTSGKRGQTWTFSNNVWSRVFNDKFKANQPPLFDLYDRNRVPLSDELTYPDNNFSGNKIFAYKVNTEPDATDDPVLGFPIVYGGIGQSSDIMFENSLITDRYQYGDTRLPISGYYYFGIFDDPLIYNAWQPHTACECSINPPNCISVSKQRVIDKFVVGYGTEFQFKLSVSPYGYPASPDIVVMVDDTEVKHENLQDKGYTLTEYNGSIYVVLEDYLTNLFTNNQKVVPVVEVQTYTHGMLDNNSPGYFEIPQSLEANPTQEEPTDFTASNLMSHFVSIIYNQPGINGAAFGGPNNYRDTEKNRSLGSYILQNETPLLKSMLVSSEDDLNFITAERFSQDEYIKFKNRFIKTAKQLINQEFSPVQYFSNTILLSLWVDEILKTINVSREFSSAFAYSYMIASNGPYFTESHVVDSTGYVILNGYADLTDVKNAMYIYDVSTHERLLLLGIDYEIVPSELSIEVQVNLDNIPVGSELTFAVYKDAAPAYIPSTPSKLGMYPVYIPRIELDTTFTQPTMVIIGHDGSKTIAYNDYRDELLLELEKRIYNLIASKFRNQPNFPIRLEDVRPGYFRETRYSRTEYLDITESNLNKWAAKYKVNYRANDWDTAKESSPVGSLWKLYNYRLAENSVGDKLNLPGHWKGIFQYMYDTYYPDTRPWEMLGISEKPGWWEYEYGAPVLNTAGQPVWTSVSQGAHNLWQDLEAGIVRQGPSAIFDPVTLAPLPQYTWARPGLSGFVPVDNTGEIRSVMEIFDVVYSGNPYEPFDGYDEEWIYGDGAPAEQAWYSSSAFPYVVQEILFLTRPSAFGEFMWDTLGTEFSPGMRDISGIYGPVRIQSQGQFVQNDLYDTGDTLYAWTRPQNKDQLVHAESVDGQVLVRFGYQAWISDRILFLGKNVGDTFGHKIRNLNVALANKLAGFTNKDTTSVYLEAISPGTGTDTLLIPTNNFEVLLHKSPVVETYSYSGVIIRALENGRFAVYGYDLLTQEFMVLNRSRAKEIEISVGGTPSPFKYFSIGETYVPGEIVRYNGVYYLNLEPQTVQRFIPSAWQKLRALPTQGGITVSYKPYPDGTTSKVPYGTVFSTAQEVFDFLIGWGAYLESKGWKFDEVNYDTNLLNDWLNSAKQFLFWLNTSWAPDASIQLSPLANRATLEVSRGYPNDIESISNGVYSILDKYGVAIPPNSTRTERDGRLITVEPVSLGAGGIFYLQVTTSETEHVIIFDNTTSFNDVVYLPLYRLRQQRLRFNGFRSNGWYGKMEAPGYLVVEDQLVPNFDTIVASMRYYYDPNVTIDNQSIEDLGRHLIGYESKSYLDNLQLSNDIQYLFYKGYIRQKGTKQAFDKLFRTTNVQTDESIEVHEEWALKLGEFGNSVEQVSTEIRLQPEQNTGEVIVARLNYVPSDIGEVRQVNILNAETRYLRVPNVQFGPPDADPSDPRLIEPLRSAKGYIVLDADGRISRVDVTDKGYGYLKAPSVSIGTDSTQNNTDELYAVWQGSINHTDGRLDNVVDIDVDQTDVWVNRPTDAGYSLGFPMTDVVEYPIPNAGYVNIDDVNFRSFDRFTTEERWGTLQFNPIPDSTMWVASNFREDWGVYKIINPDISVDVILDNAGYLLLRTAVANTIGTETIPGSINTDLGNMIGLYSYAAYAEPVLSEDLGLFSITGVDITKYGAGYTHSPAVYINGTPDLAKASVLNGQVVSITLLPEADALTWPGPPVVTVDPPDVIDYRENYTFSIEYNYSDAEYNYYYLLDSANNNISTEDIIDYTNISELVIFKTMRFAETPTTIPSYVVEGDKLWIDNYDGGWAVVKVSGTAAPPPPQPEFSIICVGEGTSLTFMVSRDSSVGESSVSWEIISGAYSPLSGEGIHGLNGLSSTLGVITFFEGEDTFFLDMVYSGTDFYTPHTAVVEISSPVNGIIGSQNTATGTLFQPPI